MKTDIIYRISMYSIFFLICAVIFLYIKFFSTETQEDAIYRCFDKKNSEKELCFLDVAEKYVNVSVCSYISEKTILNQCYLRMAVKTRNVSICYLCDSERQQACIWNFAVNTNNTGACELLGKRFRDRCILNIAKNIDNVSLCKKIYTPSLRDLCKGAG